MPTDLTARREVALNPVRVVAVAERVNGALKAEVRIGAQVLSPEGAAALAAALQEASSWARRLLERGDARRGGRGVKLDDLTPAEMDTLLDAADRCYCASDSTVVDTMWAAIVPIVLARLARDREVPPA